MLTKKRSLSADCCFPPDSVQRQLAHQYFASISALPLVCPHGHVDPALLANPAARFGSPTELFIIIHGCIVNISSMSATRVISRVVGYSAAKAAIDNFTRWLAVELAQKYGDGLRVNAIASGFFIGEQNRDLLLNADGSLSDRGQKIIDHTPAGRFGQPNELLSTLI